MEVKNPSRRTRFVTGLLLAIGVIVVALGVTIRLADLHFQTVVSGSMRPTIAPGDVAVTTGIAVTSLRVGDAIVFYPPGQSLPVLHRIRTMRTTPAGIVITTKGDANSVDDPWTVTLEGATAYRLVGVVPFLGWLTQLQRPALLVAGLLLGLAILLEVRKEVIAWRMKSQSPPLS